MRRAPPERSQPFPAADHRASLPGPSGRPGRGILAALAGACCVIASACGSARTATTTAPAPAAPAAQERGEAVVPASGPRAEIDALDRQIDVGLARAQLPVLEQTCRGAACAQAMSEPFTVPSIGDAQCRAPVPTTRCDDVCALSTWICNNQRKICELAEQLPGDDWAAGKCARARTSCKAAREQCCRCAP